MNNVKIKICGLTRECDIMYANLYKPDYVGFVFAKSRREVSVGKAVRLKGMLSPDIKAVGVFVNSEIDRIVDIVLSEAIDVVQLHGDEDAEYIEKLKHYVSLPIIKSVSVGRQSTDIDGGLADYLLLDNGAGGTGKSFDWDKADKPDTKFFLAGGLNIDNVEQGIARFSPYAVDISGGVETDGYKDEQKIKEIIHRVRNMA